MRNQSILLCCCLVFLCTFMTDKFSWAVTHCTGKLAQVWAGDDGNVWLIFENGMTAYTTPNDPDTKNILALSTVALVAGKTITIRLKEDSLACDSSTSTRDDIVGIYLNN